LENIALLVCLLLLQASVPIAFHQSWSYSEMLAPGYFVPSSSRKMRRSTKRCMRSFKGSNSAEIASAETITLSQDSSHRALEALERHRVAQDKERAKLGTLWHDTGLLFRSTTSTPVNRHNLMRRSFKPLLREAGVRDIRFHDLRHTCAKLLLSKGKHPKFVQELLGHATVSITLDTYSHVLPGMDDGLAEAMDDALS
jgi:hypothetical protein